MPPLREDLVHLLHINLDSELIRKEMKNGMTRVWHRKIMKIKLLNIIFIWTLGLTSLCLCAQSKECWKMVFCSKKFIAEMRNCVRKCALTLERYSFWLIIFFCSDSLAYIAQSLFMVFLHKFIRKRQNHAFEEGHVC